MKVTTACPFCNRRGDIPVQFENKRIRCKNCGKTFTAEKVQDAIETSDLTISEDFRAVLDEPDSFNLSEDAASLFPPIQSPGPPPPVIHREVVYMPAPRSPWTFLQIVGLFTVFSSALAVALVCLGCLWPGLRTSSRNDWSVTHRPNWVDAKINDNMIALIERSFREGLLTTIAPEKPPKPSRVWISRARWTTAANKDKEAVVMVASMAVHVGGFNADIEAWIDGGSSPVASGSYLSKIIIHQDD